MAVIAPRFDFGVISTRSVAADGKLPCVQKLDYMERQMRAEKKPSFLRTHPLTKDRIEAARRQVPEAQRVMEMSECALFSSFFDWGLSGSADSTVYNTSDSFR